MNSTAGFVVFRHFARRHKLLYITHLLYLLQLYPPALLVEHIVDSRCFVAVAEHHKAVAAAYHGFAVRHDFLAVSCQADDERAFRQTEFRHLSAVSRCAEIHRRFHKHFFALLRLPRVFPPAVLSDAAAPLLLHEADARPSSITLFDRIRSSSWL